MSDDREEDEYYKAKWLKGWERYEKVRKLNPEEYATLYHKNIVTGIPFDTLVDELEG